MNKSLHSLAATITEEVGASVKVNELMRGHTSFKIGGPADLFVQPQSSKQLVELLQFAHANDLPVTVLGNCSNVLVLDKGIRGLVIKLGNGMKNFYIEDDLPVFEAGYSLALAVHKAYELSLSGLEFAVGIPGSIGGAVYMNAGAYNGEMKSVVDSVRVVDFAGRERVLTNSDLQFAYRSTVLQSMPCVVTEVRLKLAAGDPAAIKSAMDDFSLRRITKQPLDMPSAGSTFKRPVGYYVGTLIEQAGLKGFAVGDAQVSQKHAGFIVNKGNASAQDVLGLIEAVQAKINQKYGVELVPEVLVVGEK